MDHLVLQVDVTHVSTYDRLVGDEQKNETLFKEEVSYLCNTSSKISEKRQPSETRRGNELLPRVCLPFPYA